MTKAAQALESLFELDNQLRNALTPVTMECDRAFNRRLQEILENQRANLRCITEEYRALPMIDGIVRLRQLRKQEKALRLSLERHEERGEHDDAAIVRASLCGVLSRHDILTKQVTQDFVEFMRAETR